MLVKFSRHVHDPLILNSYLLVAMRVLGVGFGFLFWAVAARLTTSGDVGLASGGVASSMLLSGLAQLGLGYGLVRYLSSYENPRDLLNRVMAVTGSVGFILAVGFLAGLQIWSPTLLPLRTNWAAGLLFVILVLSATLTQLLSWVFLASRQLTFSFMKQVSQAILGIILLFAARLFIDGFVAIVAAYTLAMLLLCWVRSKVFACKVLSEECRGD